MLWGGGERAAAFNRTSWFTDQNQRGFYLAPNRSVKTKFPRYRERARVRAASLRVWLPSLPHLHGSRQKLVVQRVSPFAQTVLAAENGPTFSRMFFLGLRRCERP